MKAQGLLWFDNDRRKPLSTKIAEAAARYKKKFGQDPNVCYVNPSLLSQEQKINGILVKPLNTILPWHILMSFDPGLKGAKQLRLL